MTQIQRNRHKPSWINIADFSRRQCSPLTAAGIVLLLFIIIQISRPDFTSTSILQQTATPNTDDGGGKKKVFGLGLSKTATTSMEAAMKLMGYNTIHCDTSLGQFMHHKEVRPNLDGFYDHTDSVWDIPTAVYYKELHQAYPNAKFILTVRSSDKWYASFKRYITDFLFYDMGCAIAERVNLLHEFVYGSKEINPSWIETFDRHNREVQEYFKPYPNSLRVINIEKDNLWAELCDYLQHEEGPCAQHKENTYPPFPSSNTATNNAESSKKCPGGMNPRTVNNKQPAKYAYVMVLCDPPSGADKDATLKNDLQSLLVVAKSIREYDKENDIVLFTPGYNLEQNHKKLLNRFGIQNQNTVPFPNWNRLYRDPLVDERTADCYLAKIRAIQLFRYEKVVYVDLDVIFDRDPSYLFQETSSLVGFDGFDTPLDGSLLAMTPAQKTWIDFRETGNSGDAFSTEEGYYNFGRFPDWRLGNVGEPQDWSFPRAQQDQGMIYYYFDKMMKDADIRKMADRPHVHFHGRKYNPQSLDPEQLDPAAVEHQDLDRYKKALVHWQELWKKLSSDKNVKEFL